MVNHHPSKFGGHKHCDSGDKMFLVVEEQDFTSSRLNSPLLFTSKSRGLKAHDYHVIGHTHLKQKLN